MLIIAHVIMGTNDSFDRLFCVDKWVKEQTELASGRFTVENACTYWVKLCCITHTAINHKGQLVMI